MQIITNTDDLLFCDYYKQWIDTYKEGAIRPVTMKKYIMTHTWLEKLVPTLKVSEFTRTIYQQLLNSYAEFHEHQTTMDFHHHVKCAILDAVDEGLISRDPTRKAIIKGKQPSEKKTKYLNQFELQKLLAHLELGLEINWDWFILLVAKTGMRFSEALALTPKDFDLAHQILSISKTWDYNGKILSIKSSLNSLIIVLLNLSFGDIGFLTVMEEFFVLIDCLDSFIAARYCLNIPFFALSTG